MLLSVLLQQSIAMRDAPHKMHLVLNSHSSGCYCREICYSSCFVQDVAFQCINAVRMLMIMACFLQVKGVMPAVTAEQQAELIDTASPFQNAYLGASLTRMSDAVTAAFPGTSRTLTSSAELQKCIA